MRKLLREPLLHFLLLGAATFVAFRLLRGREPERGTIVVSQGRVENLASGFARTWQRPPSEQELVGLVREYVREEVAAREALALGLDRDDTIVRRRLQQKLEFVSEDLLAQVEPTEAQLRVYFAANAGTFRAEPRLSFRHVYLNPERSERLASDASRLLARLRDAGPVADVAELGDPFLLEHEQHEVEASEVGRRFGEAFSARLRELPHGVWQGPVESSFGAHLVLVRARDEGSLPGFETVREAVRKEWLSARRIEIKEKFYEALLRRYDVSIEIPRGAPDGRRVTEARP